MPKTANSATALLSRLASGNRVAQEEVCRRYGKRVYSIVRRRLGRKLRARVETADVAQEAMVDILQDACGCRFASEKDFLNWVRAIVEHRIQEIAAYWGAAKRRRSREVRLPTEEGRADHRAERPSQIFSQSPTKKHLEKLPQLIDAIFDAELGVGKIKIAVEGIRLGDTGLREIRTIQSFNATRQRWSDLRIGAFQDDWEMLLSKLHPTPKYPRPEPGLPTVAWVIVVIAGLWAVYAILVKFPRMVSSS